MIRVVRDRRGIAPALAIFALVIMGALVAGSLFMGRQEQRVGDNVRRVQQSFGIAEGGAVEQFRIWSTGAMSAKATYPTDSVVVAQTSTAGGTGSYDGSVYKMNSNIYLVTVRGTDSKSSAAAAVGPLQRSGAQQRVGMLAKIRPIKFSAKGAIVATGDVKLADYITISGLDHTPAGWSDCPPAGPGVAGLHVDSLGKIGFKTPTIIEGNPPTLS